MNVVIVESPAKAKTINKYLGNGYTVLASFGHVRDLPAKNGSVKPDEDFAMVWETDPAAIKRVNDIARAVKGAQNLYLATDPDREGEAISWHVRDLLAAKGSLKSVSVQRVVFHEITKAAVQAAFKHPRPLDQPLIEAYLARRALDYLVGFTLSPVLWRKLPGSRSAGRVQSVALRLVCERESEIERFKSDEYWSIEGQFAKTDRTAFQAVLKVLDGQKLEKLSLGNQQVTQAAVERLRPLSYTVKSVEPKQMRRQPYPPFITSTLQQAASTVLGFAPSFTMKLAQQLYEGIDIGGETVGLITYMRTDGVQLAGEAIAGCRALIEQQFGKAYLPDSPRAYKSKAKNAQEAHEAIRPTSISRTPEQLAGRLSPEQLKLYTLIWKRTLACQMESAVFDQVVAEIATPDGKDMFQANGSVLKFDGFLKLYRDAGEDGDKDETSRRLPPLAVGEAVKLDELVPEQHFTQPPPRYSEASLVKKMEELGIGRPSTYASILQVLKDREYVKLEQKRFIPAERGRLVTAFLTKYFDRYVAYDFTAGLEEQLDLVSDGKQDWKALLRQFWQDFHAAIDATSDLKISDVIQVIDEQLTPLLYPTREDGRDPRQCPGCQTGNLSLKLSKFGAFVGCNRYPDCRYTRPLGQSGETPEDGQEAIPGGDARPLGNHPVTGHPLTVRKGPYGWYVQDDGPLDDPKAKPKRASLPKGANPADVTLDKAVKLLALPRTVGNWPDTGEPIIASVGPFGPYLKLGKVFCNLPAGEDVLTIGLNRAIDLMVTAIEKDKARTRELGKHPETGKDVTLKKSKFSWLILHGKDKVPLPRTLQPDTATLDDVVKMLPVAKPATKTSKTRKKAKTKQ